MPNEKDYGWGKTPGPDADATRRVLPGDSESALKTTRYISTREGALTEAIKLTCGERDKAYGPPFENLNRIANLFKAYMGDRPLSSLTATDVAAFNVLTKLSRVTTNPTHRDSWVDAAAYAAIGLECAVTGLLSVKQEG